MSDLIHRAQKTIAILEGTSLPSPQRLSQALQTLKGLELTTLAEHVRENLDRELGAVNQVLAKYEIPTDADYVNIDEADLQTMQEALTRWASSSIEAELDRIVVALDKADDRLPVEAIRETREHRDLMIPRLMQAIREAIAEARSDEVPEGQAHFFAIFLLTEFQADETFPVILEAFTLPGELPDMLFGDAITTTFAQILAQFGGGSTEILDQLIEDRSLNEFVRWEAAQCYIHLVRDGHLQRDEAVQRLGKHLRQALDREDEEIAGPLVSTLTPFAPKECLADIQEAFERHFVDTYLTDLKHVKESIAQGDSALKKELERCSPTGIEDTIEELRQWAGFQEKKPSAPPSSPPPLPKLRAPKPAPRSIPTTSLPSLLPSPERRAGRNDPCPCGSGKKYKKCCLRRD